MANGPLYPYVTVHSRGPLYPYVTVHGRGLLYPYVTVHSRGPLYPYVTVHGRGLLYSYVTVYDRGPHYPYVTVHGRGLLYSYLVMHSAELLHSSCLASYAEHECINTHRATTCEANAMNDDGVYITVCTHMHILPCREQVEYRTGGV